MNSFTRFAQLPSTMRRDESGALLVEAVVSAGADVARGDWIERLPADPSVWSLPESVPLLDNHRSGSVRDVIGTAANFRFEGGQMLATLRITVEAVAEQVERGSLGKLSMGYRHTTTRRSVENGRRVVTVTAARLSEVSLVIHPADQAAQLRNVPVPTSPKPNAAITAFLAELAAPSAESIRAELADHIAEMPEAQRAAAEARLAEIPDDELMTRFIPHPAPRTRAAAPIIRAAVAHSAEDPAVVSRRMVEALAADAAGVPVEDQGANQFRGLSFVRMAELTLDGTPGVRFLSESGILDTAFARSGAPSLGTADFPLIALGAGTRIVMHAYQEAASPIEQNLVTYGVAPDFRPMQEIQRGGIGNLKPLSEHGEIQSVSTVEAGTSWQVGTYGGKLDVTRKLLINDDKALFGTIASDMGQAARRTETQAIVDLLLSNSGNGPLLADGKSLFHADHANKPGSGAALTDVTLGNAIVAVQSQRGLGGEIIGLQPAFLVVSPALQFAAAKLLASITPATVADVNPLAGKLELIVDPRLAGAAWYVFARPSQAPVLKVGRLAGQSGPVVQQQERWDGLGTSFRVFTDFGVTAVDFRGAYRNQGA